MPDTEINTDDVLSYRPTGQNRSAILLCEQDSRLQNFVSKKCYLILIPRNNYKFLVCDEDLQRAVEFVEEVLTLNPLWEEATWKLEAET